MGWLSFLSKLGHLFKASIGRDTAIDLSLVTIVIVVANMLLLAGVFNNNPLNTRSGLDYNTKAGVLSGQNTIDPNDGYTTQALGVGAVKQVLSGHMPWWNHYEQVGAPLAGEMQSAALFPLSIFLMLPSGFLLFRMSFQIIAGLGTYLLLRRLKCSRKASIVGGICFGLNGTFAWLTNAAANPIAFLPWMILGVERLLKSSLDKMHGGYLFLSISLTLSLYAGFPETAFIDFLFVIAWAGFRFFQLPKTTKPSFIWKFVLACIIAGLLAAPILAAFTAYLPYANVGGHGGGGSGSLTTIGIPSLILPYLYGPIFGYSNFDSSGQLASFWGSVGGFTSLLTIFLALVALADKKRRGLVVLIGIWSILVIGKMFNLALISRVISAIPGVAHTAFYRYSTPSLEFGLIIAMAFGLDYLVKKGYSKEGTRIPRLPLALLVVILGVALLIAYPELQKIKAGPHAKYWFLLAIGWGIGTIGFVILWISKIRVKTSLVVSTVIVLEALLFFTIPQLSAVRHPTIDTGPVQYLQARSAGYRFYTLGPIQPNYGTYWSIASINTNNLPISKNWTAYVNRSLNNNVNPITFTGIEAPGSGGSTPIEELLAHQASYEYVGVKYVVASNEQSRILELSGLKLAYQDRHFSILELAHPQPYYSSKGGVCSVSFVNLDETKVNCKSGGSILRRELYMPGWVARDQSGRKLTLTQDGPLFQAVKVDPSTKQVVYRYEPPHIRVAYVAFLTGACLVVVTLLRDHKRVRLQRLAPE